MEVTRQGKSFSVEIRPYLRVDPYNQKTETATHSSLQGRAKEVHGEYFDGEPVPDNQPQGGSQASGEAAASQVLSFYPRAGTSPTSTTKHHGAAYLEPAVVDSGPRYSQYVQDSWGGAADKRRALTKHEDPASLLKHAPYLNPCYRLFLHTYGSRMDYAHTSSRNNPLRRTITKTSAIMASMKAGMQVVLIGAPVGREAKFNLTTENKKAQIEALAREGYTDAAASISRLHTIRLRDGQAIDVMFVERMSRGNTLI